MKLDADHDLSPQTIAALRDLLQEPVPPQEDLSDEKLRSFILGTVSVAERSEIISSLVACKSLRGRLKTLHNVLRPNESPAPEPVQTAQLFGFEETSPVWERIDGWDSLDLRRASASLKATLKAIGQSWATFLAAPRYATLRGVSPASTGELTATIFAEVLDNGTLSVDVTVETPFAGRSIVLDLLDPAGGAFRLGTSSSGEMESRFALPEFGTLAGLESGALPSNLFQVSLEDEELETPQTGYLLAEAGTDQIPITVTSSPLWRAGTVTLSLALPKSITDRYAEHELTLYAKTDPNERTLISIPISDFAKGERSIRFDAPGVGAARVLCGSLLGVRISSPVGTEAS